MASTETALPITIGQGLYTAELSSSIPEGYCARCKNFLAVGDSIENRFGMRQTSVDWNSISATTIEDHIRLYKMFDGDTTKPVLAWPQIGSGQINFLRSINKFSGVAPTGDGYMLATSGDNQVFSLASYRDRGYFTSDLGIRKITAWNWTADTITTASVTTAITSAKGLLSFKDRLWCFKSNTLYFTDIAAIGGYPETWAPATNAIIIDGQSGTSTIRQILTVSNRMVILTDTGIFTLVVMGSPGSWILRSLDARSSVNSEQAAFEAAGLIYYADNRGVWSTDGLITAKISGTIEDAFFQTSYALKTKLNYLDDGMILSIAAYDKTAALIQCNAPASRVFYSKLDNIAWSEWNIDSTDATDSDFVDYRIVEIFGTSDSVYTQLTDTPMHYMLVVTSKSTTAVPASIQIQMVVYDSSQDSLRVPLSSSTSELRTDEIILSLKTRYIDADMKYKNKQVKMAYLETFSSAANHILTSYWSLDNGTLTLGFDINEPVVGEGTSLLKIPADFMFRKAALNIDAKMQGEDHRVKIKDATLLIHLKANEPEEVR